MKIFALVLVAVISALLASAAVAQAATCTRSISPGASVQKFVDSLVAGQIGCLNGGTYTGGAKITRSGITLRSTPATHATLKGTVWVVNGANRVTLSDLTLYGGSDPSPQIMAADTIVQNSEITNGAAAICMILGNTDGYGRALRTIVRGNNFHDCGTTEHGMHDHSIYVEASTGVKIINNTFTRSSAFAIQFYPDAQGTLVSRNTMDDNGGGVIFAGEGSLASNNNIVEHNVITRSTIRPSISAWWGGKIGRGNIARYNCVSEAIEPGPGFTAYGNTTGCG